MTPEPWTALDRLVALGMAASVAAWAWGLWHVVRTRPGKPR